jgi:mannose-1-phosphate guanylyltransferase
MTLKKVTTAFVLGAGLGTRLRPLTDQQPKPLLPVQGQPMIHHVLRRLAHAGINRFIINIHHAAHCWQQIFPEPSWQGLPIHFVHEKNLLGTGGGLKNIEPLLHSGESLLLHSGDVLTNLPLEPLLQSHQNSQAEVTLALRTNPGTETIALAPDHSITHIGPPQPHHSVQDTWYDYANIALIEPPFFKRIPDNTPRSITEPWSSMIQEKTSLRGCVINQGYWHNVGTPTEYEHIQTLPLY